MDHQHLIVYYDERVAKTGVVYVKNIIPLGCSLDFLPGEDITMLLSFNALRMCLLLYVMMVVY